MSITKRYALRVRLVAFAFVLAALLLVGRLYQVQIVSGEMYAAAAGVQLAGSEYAATHRAKIFFTEKTGQEITAAATDEGFTLTIAPPEVEDPQALWEALGSYTALSEEEFLARATKEDSRRQVLATRLPADLGRALLAKGLPGVGLEADAWRVYPGGELAAHALGFVAYNGEVQEGRYGLERYYEHTLVQESEPQQNFFVELFSGVSNVLGAGEQNGDVVTTIEPTVQAELERMLAEYSEAWHPKRAGGIIMNPKTGEIVGMAMYPTFDLNAFTTVEDSATFANPLVESVFEMGSIMKPLTVAAGLDAGVITPQSTYNDTGSQELDGKTIRNFDGVARGEGTPVQEILSQSLNIGAAWVAGKLGPEGMRDYFLERYRFGKETGVDLPGEVRGLVGNLNTSRRIEFATASFGQGLATTPIAIARALASLANGGYLVTPHLGSAVRPESGLERLLGWGEPEQILKPETSEAVSRMLTEVVDTALLHGALKMEHYSIAAKTGTAQVANPNGGGYYEDRFLHSFFGYFPSYDARFLVFLFALEPQGATYASQTLAEPFGVLAKFLISYYDIVPDR